MYNPESNPFDRERLLLCKIVLGDQKAFTELFHQHQAMVYNFAFRLLKSQDKATEVVQIIFIRIWQSRERLGEVENFGAYLNRAVRNESYTALRTIAKQRIRETELSGEDLASEGSTDDRILYDESVNRLKTIVNTLPPQRKLVYQLCHEQGLKYHEVADQLNISSGTVHKHMKLALQTIRSNFGVAEQGLLLLLLYRYW